MAAGVATAHADYSYVFGESEASAYQLVDGQRVPAEKVLVRIATSQIYVNGHLADTRACSCAPATYVRDSTRNVQPGQLPSGNTAQAAVTYEVWAVRGHKPAAVVATHTVMSEGLQQSHTLRMLTSDFHRAGGVTFRCEEFVVVHYANGRLVLDRHELVCTEH